MTQHQHESVTHANSKRLGKEEERMGLLGCICALPSAVEMGSTGKEQVA
jgi:hypothetical protein